MLVIDKDTHNIKIIAKDTGDFAFELDNYFLADGDEVVFTVAEELENEQFVLQKKITEFNPDGTATIRLTSEDTNLPIGTYLYDIQINAADGRVDTVIGPAKFKVVGGVTY